MKLGDVDWISDQAIMNSGVHGETQSCETDTRREGYQEKTEGPSASESTILQTEQILTH